MKLVKHEKYEGMFYLQWPDGSKSDDFYSKTWARDNIARIEATMARRASTEPAGALF